MKSGARKSGQTFNADHRLAWGAVFLHFVLYALPCGFHEVSGQFDSERAGLLAFLRLRELVHAHATHIVQDKKNKLHFNKTGKRGKGAKGDSRRARNEANLLPLALALAFVVALALP